MKSRFQTNCDCGWSINQKIVGGVDASVNEFPAMAGLVDIRSSRIICGSTIITYKFVISAAHCVLSLSAHNLAVLVGDHDYTIGTESPYSELYNVRNIIKHSKYTESTTGYDIALIETFLDIIYSRGVGPACLPWFYVGTSFMNYNVDIVGWGTTEYAGVMSTTLKKVTLKVVPNSDCSQALRENVYDNQMCTFTKGKDTCQYDSGGGLFLRYSRMFVIGIVSYGLPCYGTAPSVDTRITSFMTWIDENTKNSIYCYKEIK